jgi:hypothetical protein
VTALAQLNERCSLNQQCAVGYCSSTDSVCATQLEAGASCRDTTKNWDDACASGDCEKTNAGDYKCRPNCTWPE